MIIKNIELLPYDLPLIQPWITSSGEFNYRKGLIVKLTSDSRIAYGDCAPLPQAGTETLVQAKIWLIDTIKTIKGMDAETILYELKQNNIQQHINHPSAYCGLETALLDLIAQSKNICLAKLLSGEALTQVKVNANMGTLYTEEDRVSLGDDFSIIKFKVGIKSVEEELIKLNKIVKTLPQNIQLRLDANGAWSYDEALKFIEGCRDFPIESLEEPMREPRLKGLQQLQKISPFIIAIDESLINFDFKAIMNMQPVKRLIIKPMRDGGLIASLSLAKHAYHTGMDCVITTTVDSAAGVWAATQLAAALGQPGKNIAHGLATSNWLVKDTGNAPEITNGTINMEGICGLGFNKNILFA